MRKGFIKRKQKNLLKGKERGTREEHKEETGEEVMETWLTCSSEDDRCREEKGEGTRKKRYKRKEDYVKKARKVVKMRSGEERKQGDEKTGQTGDECEGQQIKWTGRKEETIKETDKR